MAFSARRAFTERTTPSGSLASPSSRATSSQRSSRPPSRSLVRQKREGMPLRHSWASGMMASTRPCFSFTAISERWVPRSRPKL